MRQRGTRFIVTAVAFLACVALSTGLVFARGGGHGGGHGGHHGGGHHGGHHGSHHHNSHHHHSSHHSHHHSGHHDGHHGGYGGYGGYGGWGGWGGGWGGYAGYGYGNGWGAPVGGWGNYAADDAISVPIAGLDGANNTASYNNQSGPNEDSKDQVAQINPYDDDNADQMASNDKDDDSDGDDDEGDDEDNDIDYRGAIQLVLPNKDTHVFLNGKLVLGVGTRRLVLTPEIEDENKPEKFHVLAVWEVNGRPKQREADVELTAGGGIALNLAKDKPTESALPTVSPENAPAPAETASTETETESNESTPAATENGTEKLTR